MNLLLLAMFERLPRVWIPGSVYSGMVDAVSVQNAVMPYSVRPGSVAGDLRQHQISPGLYLSFHHAK